MVKPIPDNVKDTLNELTSVQQVILRSYIASLRSDVVSLEEEALNRTVDTDSHAHYHGHELCTADHGHGEHENSDHHEHKHTEHCEHAEHEHQHHDHHQEKEHHEHKHTEHCEHEHKSHDHEHKSHDHEHHEHKHHDHHEHKHHHDETPTATAAKEEEDIPAWKKAALSSDPSAAPFGGNWHSESNVSAADSAKPMEE